MSLINHHESLMRLPYSALLATVSVLVFHNKNKPQSNAMVPAKSIPPTTCSTFSVLNISLTSPFGRKATKSNNACTPMGIKIETSRALAQAKISPNEKAK